MGAFYVFKIVQMVPNRAKQESKKNMCSFLDKKNHENINLLAFVFHKTTCIRQSVYYTFALVLLWIFWFVHRVLTKIPK